MNHRSATEPPGRERLSAWLDSYRCDIKTSLSAAAADQFRLVSVNTQRADFSPRELGGTARRHFLRHTESLGVAVESLSAWFPGAGLADAEFAERRLAELRETLELARDLRVRRAIAPIGGLEDEQRLSLAQRLLAEAADLADRAGVTLILQDRDGASPLLADSVRRLGCPHLLLGLDSALSTPADIVARRGLIGALQLRDGRISRDGIEETALGAGDVDLPAVLGALEQTEFHGPLLVRRDSENAAVDALRAGRDYVASLLRGSLSGR